MYSCIVCCVAVSFELSYHLKQSLDINPVVEILSYGTSIHVKLSDT